MVWRLLKLRWLQKCQVTLPMISLKLSSLSAHHALPLQSARVWHNTWKSQKSLMMRTFTYFLSLIWSLKGLHSELYKKEVARHSIAELIITVRYCIYICTAHFWCSGRILMESTCRSSVHSHVRAFESMMRKVVPKLYRFWVSFAIPRLPVAPWMACSLKDEDDTEAQNDLSQSATSALQFKLQFGEIAEITFDFTPGRSWEPALASNSWIHSSSNSSRWLHVGARKVLGMDKIQHQQANIQWSIRKLKRTAPLWGYGDASHASFSYANPGVLRQSWSAAETQVPKSQVQFMLFHSVTQLDSVMAATTTWHFELLCWQDSAISRVIKIVQNRVTELAGKTTLFVKTKSWQSKPWQAVEALPISFQDLEICNEFDCPVDCEWGLWHDWSGCADLSALWTWQFL